MQEFEYYRLLLERLKSKAPLDGLKECKKMQTQAESIRQGIIKSMSKDFMAAIAKQNILKLRCCTELRRALMLSVNGVSFEDTESPLVIITWHMVLMGLVKTLEDMYQFFNEYTGIAMVDFEQSDWEFKDELVN